MHGFTTSRDKLLSQKLIVVIVFTIQTNLKIQLHRVLRNFFLYQMARLKFRFSSFWECYYSFYLFIHVMLVKPYLTKYCSLNTRPIWVNRIASPHGFQMYLEERGSALTSIARPGEQTRKFSVRQVMQYRRGRMARKHSRNYPRIKLEAFHESWCMMHACSMNQHDRNKVE